MQGTQANRVRLVVAYLTISLPLLIWGAMGALQSNSNSPIDWVDLTFQPRSDYQAFCDQFGPGDTLVVSWPGCSINDPKIDALAHLLRTSPTFHPQNSPACIGRIVTGRELYQSVLSAHGEAYARERLKDIAFGADGETTSLIIQFTSAGLAKRAEVVPLIEKAVQKVCGQPTSALKLAGPVIDGLSVDFAGKKALDQLAIPSAIVMFLMSWWCLSSLRTGAVVFAISVFCQVATLALLYYSGHRMNALLITLPPLVQVLTIASAIHFTNYVIEARHDLPPDRAAWKAVGLGWLPCTLSSGTTMVGLASLMTSGLEPVREFGLFAAVGVAISTFAVLGLLPIALTWFPPDSVREPATLKRSQHAATAITYLRWPIISVSVIVIILGSVGMSRLRTSVRIETLFGQGSSILQDYACLEKEIGPLVPIEVVVEFPIDTPIHWEDKLATIDRVRSDIRKSPEIDRVLSPADFINSDMLFMMEQQTGIGGNELPQPVEDVLVSRGMISRIDGKQAWRVTGLTSSIADVDYGELLNSLGVHLKDTVASLPKDVELRVTGIMPLVHQIQSRLLSDLFTSFLSSLALIFVTLTLVEGSLVRGFMTLLPNIFPIALLFGIWGWLDQPIDIGSVMTASIALGIAVDDTLHFVTFFRRTEQSGMSGRDALADSYFHCGRAMIQTTVCNATGLLIFAFSSFIPTSRFAWMMACLLTAALMGDLILLPALLYRRSKRVEQIADEDRFDESLSSQLSDSIFPEDEEAEQEYLATPMTSRPPHFFRHFDSNVRDTK